MNYEELEKKYESYEVEGYTGIEFWLDDTWNAMVTLLLDSIIQIYPEFKIYQLKLKFDSIRLYTNLPGLLESICEDFLEKEYESYKRRANNNDIEQESKECD